MGRKVLLVIAIISLNLGVSLHGGHSGWFTVGSTSLAAPLVAGIIASSGATANQPAYLYANVGAVIRDIAAGSNGSCPTYLCKAAAGYDGPTGRRTKPSITWPVREPQGMISAD